MKMNNSALKYIVVAPMGDYMDAIFIGIKEFPAERIILISPESRKEQAENVRADLEKYHLPASIASIDGKTEIEIWESTFKAIGELSKIQKEQELLVNVGTGDDITRSAAMSAAFVNGLKAFAVSRDKIIMLPFMRFSYYKMIPDKKMEILKFLHNEENCTSFQEMSRKAQMSLPLVSYHINGNLKSEGLRNMGLVETNLTKNKIAIKLSTLGRMVVGGYV